MRKKNYLLIALLTFVGLTAAVARAQKNVRIVSGQVISQDDAAPLEGVLVTVKGPGRPSGSQIDGMYYVEVGETDSVLVFSFPEYQTQEVRIGTAPGYCYNVTLHRGVAGVTKVPPFSPIGNWRAVFRPGPGVEIPITFDIHVTPSGELKAFFHNAEERFESGLVRQTGDSLFIQLSPFDNELAFRITEGSLTGVLRRPDGGAGLSVTAESGKDYRFVETGTKPAGDISGRYEIIFRSENGKEEKAVGVFSQKGTRLTGTFLRVTGDSRYLEGIVDGNRFYLSSFIGSGPSYYKGSFTAGGELSGEIAGAHTGQQFSGTRNEKAALPDAYTLTVLKAGYTSLDLSLPDVDGHTVSLKDKKFQNKAVILTIGGSWCPNCMDEASFLAPWYAANQARGIEIIAIQYERKTDSAYVRKVLTRFGDKYHIGYTQVFGGLADKQGVARSLPALNTFLAFPTTIFIDRKGKVDKIHTGYSGPATGEDYQAFVKEFNEEADHLLR